MSTLSVGNYQATELQRIHSKHSNFSETEEVHGNRSAGRRFRLATNDRPFHKVISSIVLRRTNGGNRLLSCSHSGLDELLPLKEHNKAFTFLLVSTSIYIPKANRYGWKLKLKNRSGLTCMYISLQFSMVCHP